MVPKLWLLVKIVIAVVLLYHASLYDWNMALDIIGDICKPLLIFVKQHLHCKNV